MIQKIQSSEYLRRVDNMTAAEKDEYINRVGEWLEKQAPLILRKMSEDLSRFQNVIQVSALWNDAECAAWNEGARLLSALAAKGDTWLPEMLYVKAARRAIRQMTECLGRAAETGMPAVAQQDTQPSGDQAQQEARPEAQQGTQPGAVKTGDPFQGEAGHGGVDSRHQDGEGKEAVTAVPVRPKHIDQYVHLLPQKTQEKAATVKGLLRDLDVAREKMRLLMDDPKASDDSRAQWAKAATGLDGKVKAIYKELDAEWEKLVKEGRVVVDDLGNARVVDKEPTVTQQDTQQEAKPEARPEAQQDTQPSGDEKTKRLEYLKKWLRDTRTKPSDERRELWKKNYDELLSLGGEVTDSIRKAGEYYGVELKTE